VLNSWLHLRSFVGGTAVAALFLAAGLAAAEENVVTARVRIERPAPAKSDKSTPRSEAGDVVLWLTPLDRSAPNTGDASARKPQVVQKDKSFHPHLTVVRAGSVVDFPNRDPFFHNVFSLFDGKRFDLGLYEAGATNSVRFDHSGVSFLFCNIHPEMSAVVVAVDTPFYAVSNKNGAISIPGVPDGRYELHVWYERSLPDALKSLSREVRVSGDSRDLGVITVPQDPGFTTAHKNKYGQDYAPPPQQTYQH
jgi:plastocyanin